MGFLNFFSKESVGAIADKVGEGAKEHAPVLLMVGATIGLGITVYEALKAKTKVDDILAETKEAIKELDKVVEGEEPLGEKEKEAEVKKIKKEAAGKVIKAVAKPVTAGVTTVSCMWGANYLRVRQIRSLTEKLMDTAALYDISQEALKKYRENTAAIVGEDKANEIQRTSNESMTPRYVTTPNAYYTPSAGDPDAIWFVDTYLGRRFKATRAAVDRGVNAVNSYLVNDCSFQAVNDLFWEIGEGSLPAVGAGEEHGWNPENGPLSLNFEAHLDETGRPYCTISYDVFLRDTYGDY